MSILFFSLQYCERIPDAFFEYNCVGLRFLIKNIDIPYYIGHHMLQTHVLDHQRFISIVKGVACSNTSLKSFNIAADYCYRISDRVGYPFDDLEFASCRGLYIRARLDKQAKVQQLINGLQNLSCRFSRNMGWNIRKNDTLAELADNGKSEIGVSLIEIYLNMPQSDPPQTC